MGSWGRPGGRALRFPTTDAVSSEPQTREGAWWPGFWSHRDSCATVTGTKGLFLPEDTGSVYAARVPGGRRWLVCSRISCGNSSREGRGEAGSTWRGVGGGRGSRTGEGRCGWKEWGQPTHAHHLRCGGGAAGEQGVGEGARGVGSVKCQGSPSPPSGAGPRPAPSPNTSPRPHPVGPAELPKA